MFTHIHVHALAPASFRRPGLVAASGLVPTAAAMDTSATGHFIIKASTLAAIQDEYIVVYTWVFI